MAGNTKVQQRRKKLPPKRGRKANLTVCHRIAPTIHERGYGNAIATEKRKKSGRLIPEAA